MTREDLDRLIQNNYGVQAERLFAKSPATAIYRHPRGRKWFAVIMEISSAVFGQSPGKPITVVNLKTEPLLGDLLKTKSGIYPAYHMNKEKWISVRIDENTDENELLGQLAMSYRLTKTKKDFEWKE